MMRIFRMYLYRPILIVLGLLLVWGGAWRTIGTVPGRVAQYGSVARQRLQPYFARADVPYPPRALVLVGLKDTQTLQLYAPDRHGVMRLLRAYPIHAASGHLGPKLREGDLQVPEGIYHVESLNPRSLFHLSLRLDYPNAFDHEMARHDGRTQLGGDIMIHGSAASAGCLAMGNPAS
ncbi:MAG TPA: hypothetical protein VGL77_12800, partial [Armatimonadota bacterium]